MYGLTGGGATSTETKASTKFSTVEQEEDKIFQLKQL
jgi:hypothetical protein